MAVGSEHPDFDKIVKDSAEGYPTVEREDLKHVYRQAKSLTDLSKDMETMRDFYENELLLAYMNENMKEDEVQSLVQEYT